MHKPGLHSLWLRVVCGLLMPGAPAWADPGACAGLAGETIRFVVPNAAGGGYDAYARLLKPFIAQRLDAKVFIDNEPQAGGVVGAIAVRDAQPDGKTLGLINATGLLAAQLEGRAPNPAQDFTILARVVANHTVMFTGSGSGIADIEALLGVSAQRPIVVGVRDAGSSSLMVVPIAAHLLGLRFELVTGYVGTAARALAAIRGEIDIQFQNYDSARRYVEAGELRPLLQLSPPPPGRLYEKLAQLPVLTGPDGMADRLAQADGRRQAMARARALAMLARAGRLIVAPPGMREDRRVCLRATIDQILASAALEDAAGRAGLHIDAADAATTEAELLVAAQALPDIAPVVRAAMQRARQ